MTSRYLLNPHVTYAGANTPTGGDPLAYHRKLPGYARTRLAALPVLARELGVGRILVKDESSRLGLPAFKALGASWAVYRVLRERLGGEIGPWATLEELNARLEPLRPLTLVAATDGNHGRAVAHMAQLFGLGARIFVPRDMVAARRQAIASEGAEVVVVDGSYDDAVARSAREAGVRTLVISDTAWPGYTEVPSGVIEGYSTIFREIDDELTQRGEEGPDVVLVQIGVGALAAATVRYCLRPDAQKRPVIVGVEPVGAACALASIQAGKLVTLPGPQESIMAGLNCGTPSLVAWPLMSSGIRAFVAVEDERAREAMRALAREGIVAGETGGSGLAGLLELLRGPEAGARRVELGIGDETRVLVIVTEGATDPGAYARIVGETPA
jgi:diaminopropionate ammonia-lyase